MGSGDENDAEERNAVRSIVLFLREGGEEALASSSNSSWRCYDGSVFRGRVGGGGGGGGRGGDVGKKEKEMDERCLFSFLISRTSL